MRSLRWGGLLFSLLIVGVLGGLMAPLPSEAATVKLQIDGSYNIDPANPLSNTGTDITLTEVTYNTSACPAVSGYPAAPANATAPGTKCFTLATGGTFTGSNGRQYTISAYGGPPSPRLLIVDQGGGTAQDIIALSNIEIKPIIANNNTNWWDSVANNTGVAAGTNCITGGNCGEGHTLYITIDHTFNRVTNPESSGNSNLYPFSLRVSGMFNGVVPGVANVRNAGPPGATGSGDYVYLIGEGYFTNATARTRLVKTNNVPAGIVCDVTSPLNSNANPLDVLYCPLQQTKGWTVNPSSSFATGPALVQNDTSVTPNYPTYFCDNGTNCIPRITELLMVTMYGPDSLQIANSWEAFGGISCNLTSPDPGGGPSSNPAIPCHSNGKKNADAIMTQFLGTVTTADLTTYMTVGADDTASCQDVTCPCGNPAVCSGTIVAVVRETPATAGLIFPFDAIGQGIPPTFNICTSGVYSNGNCIPPDTVPPESETFSPIFVTGGPWSITADTANFPPIDPNTHWEADSINCASLLNQPLAIPPVIVSTWTVDSGSVKKNATVTKLGVGDKVTCTWHIHKNSGNN